MGNDARVVWNFDRWPEYGGETVEFKLIYSGRLPAASATDTRSFDKHAIRKILHRQLRELWCVQPPLSRWLTQIVPAPNAPVGLDGRTCTVVEAIANSNALCGFRFIPIVTEQHALSCELDILFLRRDAPGKVISAGGDIDNRIKVLFDALRMPKDRNEVGNAKPEKDEDPFYVLLQDDSLITKISVSTDRLLTPQGHAENINDVHLVIGVRVRVVTVNQFLSNIQFLDG